MENLVENRRLNKNDRVQNISFLIQTYTKVDGEKITKRNKDFLFLSCLFASIQKSAKKYRTPKDFSKRVTPKMNIHIFILILIWILILIYDTDIDMDINIDGRNFRMLQS